MSARALFLALVASLVLAAPALGAPDVTTGGVEVPGTPTGGTEGGAFLPQAGEAPSEVQPPAQRSAPTAVASRAGAPRARAAQNGGEPDVDIEVPVPPDQQPQPTAPPQPPAGASIGLASTGFAAGLLGLIGLGFGAAGLTLLRMSAPARMRRRAERRAQQGAGHRTGCPAHARAR